MKRDIIYYSSIVLYIASCVFPCLETQNEVMRGWQCLLLGWLSILCDMSQFVIWASNIGFFAAFFMVFREDKAPMIVSGLTFLLGLSMLVHPFIMADGPAAIIHFHIGYYLWIASYLTLFIYYLLEWYMPEQDDDPESTEDTIK